MNFLFGIFTYKRRDFQTELTVFENSSSFSKIIEVSKKLEHSIETNTLYIIILFTYYLQKLILYNRIYIYKKRQ